MKEVQEKKDQLFKQIDFYFSDSNLPFDKFLKGECEAEGGWVDLSVVIAFSRVQALLGKEWKTPDAVSDEAIQAVASVMRDSTTVEISEDGYQIRRKDMPSDWSAVIAEVTARTIHVALLPFDTTLDKVGTYFTQFGTVRQVRLLKYSDLEMSGVFRGAALLEMGTKDEATALLGQDLKYEGATLRTQTKSDYDAAAAQARKSGAAVHTVDVMRPKVTVEGLPPDPPVPDGEAPDESISVKPASSPRTVVTEEAEEGAADEPYVVKDDEKDRLVKFEVNGDLEGLASGRGLRESFGGTDKGVCFVDHNQGENSGVIRFSESTQARELIEKCDPAGEFEIASGHKLNLSMMTGVDEAAAWKKINADFKRRAANKRQQRGGHGMGRHVKRGRR